MATATGRSRFIGGFGWQVLAGMVAGLALGLLARQLGAAEGQPGFALSEALRVIGSTFVQFLRALAAPLVFTAIVASIANLAELKGAAGLVWRTLMWFAITALISVSIAVALGLVMQPGVHAGRALVYVEPTYPAGTWLSFLNGLVPANFLGLVVTTRMTDGHVIANTSFNILQILVLALVTGTAALKIGEPGRAFLAFNASALAVVRKVLSWVIRLTPIGSLGLLGTAAATYGIEMLGQLGTFAVAVYIGLLIVMFVVYPALLAANGLNPLRFFAGAWPAIQLAFVSRSSLGTLPVTETVTHERLGVPKAYAAFAVPLAATTKMDGCAAIYPALAAIFVAQFYGVPLHVTDYLLIVLVSVLGSAATAGMTGAVVMLTLTLTTLGLPLEGAGLLFAIDPILDMGRTALNVAGQALAPTIVAKRQGILDLEVYNRTAKAPEPALA